MSRHAANIYKFISPTDNQLLKFLSEAYGLEESSNFSVHTAPGVSTAYDGDNESVTEELIKNGKGRQILQANFQCSADNTNRNIASFTFNRGESTNNVLQPSLHFAEILFTNPHTNAESSSEVANLIEKHFKTSLPESSVSSKNDAGIFVTQLAEISTSIAETLSNSQIKAEKSTQERIQKLDEQAEKLREGIEEERLKLHEEYEGKAKALDTRESDLNNARARSERRGLRQSINEALKNSLNKEISPKSAKFAKFPIVFVALVGLAFSLFFAFFSFDQFATLIKQIGQISSEASDAPAVTDNIAINWLFASLLLRGSLGLIAATFFGYYLIRYFKNVEDTANRRALGLERYLFDIDRASWVIETIMELKEEEGITAVPDAWLKGATHNLFGSNDDENHDAPNPLEALGELLATGAKLKVGNGSGELEIQPKAAKKVAKQSKP